jgi:sulfite reductase alpha subunit-like flavoprotein
LSKPPPPIPNSLADIFNNSSIDGTLGPWLTGLWKVALEKYPIPSPLKIIPEDVIFKNSFSLVFDPKEPIDPKSSQQQQQGQQPQDFIQEPNSYLATLLTNKRNTNEKHNQDVRHIELLVNDPVFPGYHPGDVLTMRPRNLEKDVNEFLDYNGWTSIADDPLTIVENLSGMVLLIHTYPSVLIQWSRC